MSKLKLSRRAFLWTAGLAGGGLLVGIALRADEELPVAARQDGFIANAFIEIGADNAVRFHCPRDEMGQGITTGLATLVAEELDVAPRAMDVVLAGVHSAYANPAFGVQATGGSTSIRAHFLPLREAAANVRALLLNAAAADLGVAAASLRTEDAHVLSNGSRLPYARFLATARTLEMPTGSALKAAAGFKYIGKDFARLDGVAKATGTASFGIDTELPGMLHAVVRRSPVPGAEVTGFDASAAQAMPGVQQLARVASGVAVIARSFWQATRAADALDVQWSPVELDGLTSDTLKADYQQALASNAGVATKTLGDVASAMHSARFTIDAEYWAPYLAHAPMEPMNATVHIARGKAQVWTGSQGPAMVQGIVARISGLERRDVVVHNTYLGGGFGRRGALQHVAEAAELAVLTGKPVQVTWTRADDIRHGPFRPAALMRIRAGSSEDGQISAWQATRVGANIFAGRLREALPALTPALLPVTLTDWAADAAGAVADNWIAEKTSIEGLHGDYDFQNREVRHVTRDHGLPVGYWRSVGHSYSAFAKESALDELAHAAGLDPLELRLRNTHGNPRLQQVIRIAGEYMRAARPAPGRALGLAAHGSFHSFVAQVAEVSIEQGVPRVHKVLCVVDCGLAVNPDIVRAQMEGAIVYGLSAALHGDLELRAGAVVQSNFHDYPVLRMHESPEIEVRIVQSQEPPSGAGEPGLPPIAPAVANAIFKLTGKRLRALPLRLA